MKRSERTKVITEALERLAQIESSGALLNPESSKELDIYGFWSSGRYSQDCVVATYVRQRTGLCVEVLYSPDRGYICVYEDVDKDVAVMVPRTLGWLIYDFDHRNRPWLER